MIHSMTAFARAEQASANGTLSWELRSSTSLPRTSSASAAFRDLRRAVREALRTPVTR
jgi:uncharacterized protein YicC (UPF0701 family)